MPIHDWTKVSPGIFHAFHVAWIGEIQKSLNANRLPAGYYALAEQVAGNTIPVLTLRLPDSRLNGIDADHSEFSGGTAVAAAPPRVALTDRLTVMLHPAVSQRQISIRHQSGDRIVAVIELISPGNKDKAAAVEQFADKAAAYFDEGIHLLIIDLFPPGVRDPLGIHSMIWTRLGGDTFTPPPGKPLTLSAYNAGTATCYVEPTAVGTALIEMPLFFTPERYVNVPLEQTYMAAYEGVPRRWKQVIEAVN